MAIEREAGLDRGLFAASNSLRRPSEGGSATSGYNSNETPTSANAGTFGTDRPLPISVLEDLDRIESPIVRRAPKQREHVVLHQQWEGYVERLTPRGFEALLVDITGRADKEERTEIDLDEVSEFDRPLIAPGAGFYWGIGYLVRTSGQREGMSIIRFRCLPAWTPEELAEADHAAGATRAALGWDREPNVALGDVTSTG